MDGFDEKKWFVYMGDHHEGPFSLADIQTKMTQSLVTTASYVWSEGMGDWKPMTEVSAFESLTHGAGAIAAPAPTLELAEVAGASPSSPMMATAAPGGGLSVPAPAITLEVATEAPSSDTANRLGSQSLELMGKVSSSSIVELATPVNTLRPIRNGIHGSPAPAAKEFDAQFDQAMKKGGGQSFMGSPERKSLVVRITRLSIFAGIPAALLGAYMGGYLNPVLNSRSAQAWLTTVSDVTRPYLTKAVEKVPALGRWISPIPAIKDIDPAEYEELKAAAMTSFERNGPRIAVAVSRSDMSSPVFYVSTNLPDGAKFDVFIEGISDALLNQLSYQSIARATSTRRLGQTPTVRFPDGRPLPKGQFLIYVTEATDQPAAIKAMLTAAQPVQPGMLASVPKGKTLSMISKDVRTLAYKSYFLGGPKDRIYTERLRAYHEKLQTQAKTELTEVKQFALTLDSRLGETIKKFNLLRKGKVTPVQKKEWAKFHELWNKFNSQINETFQKWTPQAIQNDFFYGTLYQMTQTAGGAVGRLHSFQDAYFNTPQTDPKAFEIKLGEAASSAQTGINQLKAKVEQAEKLAPTQNGMPQREGI